MEAIKSAVTKKVWERAAFEFQEPPQNNNQEDQEQPQPEELRPEDVEQILEERERIAHSPHGNKAIELAPRIRSA